MGPRKLKYDDVEASKLAYVGPTRRGRLAKILVLPFVLLIILSFGLNDYIMKKLWLAHDLNSFQADFFHNITVVRHGSLWPGIDKEATSYAGYIGLNGSLPSSPRRSFFWYFQAERRLPKDAPVILSVGGGPGSSGLLNPFLGQGPLIVNEFGRMVSHPDRWTEKFNLLALDHPIGAGFSYGPEVANNSISAALDVYDFLQKFYRLFPYLAKNPLVLCSGSYGGIYIPNIATVINEQNRALANGKGQPGAIKLNLESLIVSNPISDAMSYFTSFTDFVCTEHPIYGQEACDKRYSIVPKCVQKLQLAFSLPTTENRVDAAQTCSPIIEGGDWNGTVREDIRRKCIVDENNPDPLQCFPRVRWIAQALDNPAVKDQLGVPPGLNYTPVNPKVAEAFWTVGDPIAQHHILYENLLKDGIRLLHYVGTQDANCNWRGVFAMLKLIRSQYQEAFIDAKDIPWPSEEARQGTVRVIGEGAGNMTMFLMDNAGHLVVHDQPKLAKTIIEHWIENRPFFPEN